MRRLFLASAYGPLMLAVSMPAHAQVPAATAIGAAASGNASAPAISQAATPTPAQNPPSPAPTPAQNPPAAAPTGPLADVSRSLFEPTWNTFQLAGRFSSVEGDPARWQRYQDLRDGLLFTDARLRRETIEWTATGGVDNLGWRDQRFFGTYERSGRFQIRGLWDQIPQFYSVDTKTAFTSAGEGVLVLDDAAQRAASHTAYLSISPQFDLRERRDVGTVRLSATPSARLDLTGGFTTTKHSGELPWGASFGFSNDNEVALPYNSRTNDMDAGVQWTNERAMIRGAYSGSWFNNIDDTLIWDNPLVLTDSSSASGHGRTALWPSNSLQTLSTSGYGKFAHRTQVTGSLAFGWWDNNEPLLPFTINGALPQFALPRPTAEASAHTVATNISVVSRPQADWRLSSRFRRYDYDNQTPETAISDYISYDTSVATTPTGGPALVAHSRNTFDADATWTKLRPVALTIGYTNNHNGYDSRIFESSNENVLQLNVDTVGSQWVTFRAHYEYGSRTGSGLDEQSLVDIGEQPQLRHYDIANRTRNRLVGQVDVVPSEALTLSLSTGIGQDDFDDSYFGLQETSFRNVSVSADYQVPSGLLVGGTYNYERYTGLQQSRSANPGEQAADPNRNWTADTTDPVHYVSIFLQPASFGATEARFSYDYAHAVGNFVYTVGPALPAPSQLPQTFNTLQDLRFDLRHRVTGRVAANFSYTYERSTIFDFAFDPSVIDSIVQPSSLILGYTYRPFTTHSAVFGIFYYW